MNDRIENVQQSINILENKLKLLSKREVSNIEELGLFPDYFGFEYISGNLTKREKQFKILIENWEKEYDQTKIKMDQEINFSKSGEYNKVNVRSSIHLIL